MKVGLLFAGYVVIFFGLRASGSEWRAAAIGAAIVWGVLAVTFTELLSLLGGLTPMNLAIAWLVVDVAALVYFWRVLFSTLRWGRLASLGALHHQMTSRLPKGSMALLWGMGALLALVALVALLSPPNTWDVMAYHMPRIVHWMQNQSVAFYPTPELRQLYLPPGAEYAILQLHVLFGSDRLNNFVQWFSFLGSVIGVTLLARCMGAGYGGQVLAAVICATIPQGILEASGAKNDYVVAFWLVGLAYYLFRFQREPTLTNTLGIGGALGLAWLTKGTAYVFSLPMLSIWALALPGGAKTALFKRLPFLVVVVLALNSGHFVRNYSAFGSPLGPSAGHPSGAFKLTNDELTAAGLMSNILRNLALHLGTPIMAINTRLEQWIEMLIRSTGDDPNNPRTTWTGTTFHVPEMSRHEAIAGNPFHLMLIVLALGLMIGRRDLRTTSDVAIFTVGMVLAFLLFCALLRWQPWHSRLHLPLFVLSSPVVGIVLMQVWALSVTNGLGMLLIVLSIPIVLGNQLRPLAFGGGHSILYQERSELYFTENRELVHAYRLAAEFVKEEGCESIGLDVPGNSPAYPLYVFLEADARKRHIQHVGVRNPSAQYGQGEEGLRPCAVICLECTGAEEKWNAYSPWIGPATIFQHIVVFGGKSLPRLEGPSP